MRTYLSPTLLGSALSCAALVIFIQGQHYGITDSSLPVVPAPRPKLEVVRNVRTSAALQPLHFPGFCFCTRQVKLAIFCSGISAWQKLSEDPACLQWLDFSRLGMASVGGGRQRRGSVVVQSCLATFAQKLWRISGSCVPEKRLTQRQVIHDLPLGLYACMAAEVDWPLRSPVAG